jgi:hypothetical protein
MRFGRRRGHRRGGLGMAIVGVRLSLVIVRRSLRNAPPQLSAALIRFCRKNFAAKKRCGAARVKLAISRSLSSLPSLSPPPEGFV